MLKTYSLLCWLLSIGICAGFDVVVTESTSIATNDMSLDGQAVLVDGAALTLDGEHVFDRLTLTNGAVLTHSASVSGLVFSVIGRLEVAADSRLDVRGRGYLGGAGGNTYDGGHGPGGGLAQWYVGGGGSHGGTGGTCSDGAGGGTCLM